MIRDTLTKLIEEQQRTIKDDVRNYIGASSIGSECLRQIWYEYKGYPSEGVPAKTRRTWAIGKHLEALVVQWLDKTFPGIGEPFHVNSKNVPIFQGTPDATVLNEWGDDVEVLEIKTAKDASFKIFKAKGVKLWNPQYYAQIQAYMGMSGIHKAYILVLNKDNSELSDELVEFDAEYYKALEERARMIASADVEPPRISGSPLWYKCKSCKYNKVCHV